MKLVRRDRHRINAEIMETHFDFANGLNGIGMRLRASIAVPFSYRLNHLLRACSLFREHQANQARRESLFIEGRRRPHDAVAPHFGHDFNPPTASDELHLRLVLPKGAQSLK